VIWDKGLFAMGRSWYHWSHEPCWVVRKKGAHCLGLSHSTVKHHLANARSKVGAATTAQLVWILAPRLPEPEGLAQPDD